MKKEISHEELLRKIFSAAYCFKHLGYYGSKEKAIKALLKRKGLENYSRETAINQFEQALQIVMDTKEFIEIEINSKTPLVYMKSDGVNIVMDKLRDTLRKKNHQAPMEMIQFSANWVYTDYYLR